eukprot:snap_masked-scaffold_26-processed-gene-4.57-mRNA-1 protein AED:1.00 eAED:1.00 QI:0/0/0/0/1/1/2/0/61
MVFVEVLSLGDLIDWNRESSLDGILFQEEPELQTKRTKKKEETSSKIKNISDPTYNKSQKA